MTARKKEMWEFDLRDWGYYLIKKVAILTPFVLLGMWLKPTGAMFLYLLGGIAIGFVIAVSVTN